MNDSSNSANGDRPGGAGGVGDGSGDGIGNGDGNGNGDASGDGNGDGDGDGNGNGDGEGHGDSRTRSIARAERLVEKREYAQARVILDRLYLQSPPPRRLIVKENDVARLLSRISGVTTSTVLLVPLCACLAVPGFGRWGLGFLSWVWFVPSLFVAFFVSTLIGYIAWRPRQGFHAFLLLGIVAANTVQWMIYPPSSAGAFLAAHGLGAPSALFIVAVAARALALASPGAKLAYLATVGASLCFIFLAYGASPWALPVVAVGALLTGPIWSRLFPPQEMRQIPKKNRRPR